MVSCIQADSLPSELPGKPNVKFTPNFKDLIQKNTKYFTDNFYIIDRLPRWLSG